MHSTTCSIRGLTTQVLAGFVLLAAFGIVGCGGSASSDKRLKDALEGAKIQEKETFPLAGKVTVDGKPPGTAAGTLIIMLNDLAKPDLPLDERNFFESGADGNFSFSSYRAADGLEPGNYILTIARLKKRGKRGYFGPDEFHNLYNDPEKSEFKIDHKAPGKKDYVFDLKIEGREPVTTPGPKALIELKTLDKK